MPLSCICLFLVFVFVFGWLFGTCIKAGWHKDKGKTNGCGQITHHRAVEDKLEPEEKLWNAFIYSNPKKKEHGFAIFSLYQIYIWKRNCCINFWKEVGEDFEPTSGCGNLVVEQTKANFSKLIGLNWIVKTCSVWWVTLPWGAQCSWCSCWWRPRRRCPSSQSRAWRRRWPRWWCGRGGRWGRELAQGRRCKVPMSRFWRSDWWGRWAKPASTENVFLLHISQFLRTWMQ